MLYFIYSEHGKNCWPTFQQQYNLNFDPVHLILAVGYNYDDHELDQHDDKASSQEVFVLGTYNQHLGMQSWALSVFFNLFNTKKLLFAFFIKLIWLGVGFLNRTAAEIGY